MVNVVLLIFTVLIFHQGLKGYFLRDPQGHQLTCYLTASDSVGLDTWTDFGSQLSNNLFFSLPVKFLLRAIMKSPVHNLLGVMFSQCPPTDFQVSQVTSLF